MSNKEQKFKIIAILFQNILQELFKRNWHATPENRTVAVFKAAYSV